jgi:hypothetical protein
MAGMFSYSKAVMERAMKVQEVILQAMAKKITPVSGGRDHPHQRSARRVPLA